MKPTERINQIVSELIGKTWEEGIENVLIKSAYPLAIGKYLDEQYMLRQITPNDILDALKECHRKILGYQERYGWNEDDIPLIDKVNNLVVNYEQQTNQGEIK